MTSAGTFQSLTNNSIQNGEAATLNRQSLQLSLVRAIIGALTRWHQTFATMPTAPGEAPTPYREGPLRTGRVGRSHGSTARLPPIGRPLRNGRVTVSLFSLFFFGPRFRFTFG